MQVAAERTEGGKLSRALLTLLIRMDDMRPLTVTTVISVFGTIRARLPEDLRNVVPGMVGGHSAALRDLTTLSGTLMSRRLPGWQVRDLVGEVLRHLDPDRLGSKIAATVEALVRSLAGRDPDAMPWLEEVFWAPGTAPAVRMSIAKTFTVLAPGRANTIKSRHDCPPEIVTLIVSRTE